MHIKRCCTLKKVKYYNTSEGTIYETFVFSDFVKAYKKMKELKEKEPYGVFKIIDIDKIILNRFDLIDI